MVKMRVKSQTFGERLKEARVKRGLTQEEIAQELGIKQQRYQPWESGKGGKQIEPPQDMLQKLASVLDVDVNWLLAGTTAEEPAHYGYDRTTLKVIDILQSLDEDMRKEILKYAEEKKIVAQHKKRH